MMTAVDAYNGGGVTDHTQTILTIVGAVTRAETLNSLNH